MCDFEAARWETPGDVVSQAVFTLDVYAYQAYIVTHEKDVADDRTVIPSQASELEVGTRDGARQQ